MSEKIELLLKARAHWRSDDERKTRKMYKRFDEVEHESHNVRDFVEKDLTPIITLLLEQVNLQMAAEEQDLYDRDKVALYGAQTGSTQIISPRAQDLPQDQLCSELDSHSKHLISINDSQSSLHVKQTVASAGKQRRDPKPTVVKMDNECISCSGDVNKVTKLFKLACLGYRSQPISYRNANQITRDKFLMLRKFLVGQAMFVVRESERLQTLKMSPKRVFDDTFVHF